MKVIQKTKLATQLRRAKVAEIFKENPYINPSEIAEILGVASQTIYNDIREITKRLTAESTDAYNMHRERLLKEISDMKTKCKEKLKLCKGATAGSRWVEEWTKLTEKECKILGIYAPDRAVAMVAHVSGDDELSKKRRDAVVDAILSGHEKGIIEIGVATKN